MFWIISTTRLAKHSKFNYKIIHYGFHIPDGWVHLVRCHETVDESKTSRHDPKSGPLFDKEGCFYIWTNVSIHPPQHSSIWRLSMGEQKITISIINMIFSVLIIFSVVTTLSCSTLIFNSLIISVRHKCAATFLTATSFLLLLLLIFFHILTNTKFVHVTPTYYHSWYFVFEFTFNVTYFRRVSDI